MNPIIIAALITAFGAIITPIIVKLVKKKKKKPESIVLSRTIELSNSVKKASEKFEVPVSLIKDAKIFKHRVQQFDDNLIKSLETFGFDSIPPIHEIPELFASYSIAKTKYAHWGDKVDINLILRVLIERLKSFNQKDEIYYDQALNNLALITLSQLKLLVLHNVIYGLYQFLAAQNNDVLPNLKNLLNYLRDDFDVNSIDIDHLISQGLIKDMSPKRYPEIIIAELDPKIQELKDLINSLLAKFLKLQLYSYNLSPVCKIISSLKIKELLNANNIGFIYPKTEYADLYVKNLIATAEVTAYASDKNEEKQK